MEDIKIEQQEDSFSASHVTIVCGLFEALHLLLQRTN
jgi:hypothetical protein